jgi:hypothetical protein
MAAIVRTPAVSMLSRTLGGLTTRRRLPACSTTASYFGGARCLFRSYIAHTPSSHRGSGRGLERYAFTKWHWPGDARGTPGVPLKVTTPA